MNPRVIVGLSVCCLAFNFLFAAPEVGTLSPEYLKLKAEAEKFFSERSYASAAKVYQKAAVLALSGAEQRWVEFRLADAQWRAQASTQTADNTQLEQARQTLDKLVRDLTRVEDHDRVWAEVQESLGDFHWARPNQHNWGAAWPYYQQALDWWAGAADIELARERYLSVVWRLAKPPGAQPYYSYGAWGNILPLDILENALKIVRAENDKAHANYLLAMTIRSQGGDWDQRARVPELFEAAIKAGKTTDWHDDALYNYAEWMLSQGQAVQLPDGNWRQEPDYIKALALFRELVSGYAKGESRYWDQAQNQISSITNPQLTVSIPHIFLPDSEIQYFLSWRNVKRVELSLFPVELNRDVKLRDQTHWIHCIGLSGSEAMKTWSRDTDDKGDYRPGQASVQMDEKLKPGAYVLEAKAGGVSTRELILVTDALLVLKASGKQALVWFTSALDGEPLGGAKVKLSERWHEEGRAFVHELEATTDQDGVAKFELKQPLRDNSVELFASAILKNRQAFSTGVSYQQHRNDQPWKIYAFTDRPAYRPKETVQWKFIARRYDGSVYSTPSDQSLEYQVDDPRGAKVKDGKVQLNAFGSAWGSLELTDQMPLGEYRVQFWNEGRKHYVGTATLFRLEEYKLPEFKVTIQTPEEAGRKKGFRLGDKVEVNIQADYYFGGPVANATVEVLVYQNPFYHIWHKPREFPWFYEDIEGESRWNRWYGGQGQIIKRETLKTDAAGKASLSFETPRGSAQEFEYRIEARVTDSSRREIVGNGSVRVTRQRYYVYANPGHYLYRPQEKVVVEFRAMDANDQPVQTEGVAKVTRDYWYEVWISPEGKEIKGDELKRWRAAEPVFPPPPKPGAPGWTLKFRGYEHEEVLTRTLKTDTNGIAELSFAPEREGYYRVGWSSQDPALKGPSAPITAGTTVWVATGATTELGYRQGSVQIIADKDTFRVGQKAPIMLVVPTNDRHVLFTVEGEELYSHQVVHLEGSVKLLELPVEEMHVPNIFLGAAMVSDRQVHSAVQQIVVPPTRNFLTVDVKPERAEYQPQEEGLFTVSTRDHEGKPVPAEIAFSLVDESVFYIQQDYAGDPRQFYFGTKRPQLVQLHSTIEQKSYAKLIKSDQNQLLDERDVLRRQPAGQAYEDYKRKDAYDADDSGALAADKMEPMMMGGGGLGGAAPSMRARGMVSRSVSEAMPASAPMARLELKAGAAEAQEPAPSVFVRTDFRSTVLWRPDLVTDQSGTTTVRVKYPDSLTGWKASARVASRANEFGIATAATRTRQPLIVRLQSPRFFIVGDVLTLSAVINNNTEQPAQVKVTLEVAGQPVLLKSPASKTVSVPANGEARADWLAEVNAAGAVKLKVTGLSAQHADAMERIYTSHEHGLEKFLAKSGKARANDFTIKIDLPAQRKPGSTSLSVQVTPSLAVTMLDSLPYLIRYPYGCTEQTMSRFLPAAITAKTLKDLGLQPEDIMGRVFGGVEQSHADATHPDGKVDLAELDKIIKAGLERLVEFQHSDGGWGWWKDGESDHWMSAYVVWGLSLAADAGVTSAGAAGKSGAPGAVDPNTGLPVAALVRGAGYLDKTLVEQEENLDMQAWMLHALAVFNHSRKIAQPSAFQAKAFDNLWNNREKLNAYTRALLALAAHHFGRADQARVLVRNLENGVKRDERPDTSVLIHPGGGAAPAETVIGTAHWGEDGIYWRWSEGGVEATAFALRALLTIDPENKLIEPVTNWLIRNRRGAQWNSTRDTAIVVLALNDYLRTSGELKADSEFEVLINGSSIADEKLSGADLLKAPSRYIVDPKLVKNANEIRIRRKGSEGNLYFAVEAKFFSLEEPVTPAGNEIFVKREYFKLVGRPTLLKGYVYEKETLRDGETVKSGERVETLLTIEAKNNYEYLVFEDLKPAGLEAVEVRSGETVFARELKAGGVQRKFVGTEEANSASGNKVQSQTAFAPRRIVPPAPGIVPPPRQAPNQDDYTGRTRWVYQELRDRKVALFLDKLPEGVWEIRYDLRAEVPGRFHALPVAGYAMYVPEIRCNGAEVRLTVAD